jgi:hypothetical protein
MRGAVAEVHYVYLVADHAYLDKRVQFGNVNGSAEWAALVASQHPVGPGRVFYRPDAPDKCVLIPGSVRPSTYFALALGLFFGAGGLYCLARAYAQLSDARSNG